MILGLILVLTAFGGRLNVATDHPSGGARSPVAATAAEPAAAPDSLAGVVLLQDGGVLEGQVTRAADWYVVRRGGGQLQIASARVLFVGRSLHDAYEYRRRHATQPTAESHVGLAEWCLRHNLVDEAGSELENARKLGGSQGRLALLERRLAATKERLAQKSTAAVTANAQASASKQSTSPAPVSRDLPAGVLEMFTRKVQPVLVNNCTVSKCHQPGGQQSYQLNRALLRGEANRRTTMQNLSATLALVDRAHPEASPLLTVPRQTHGGMNGPIFGARQEQAFKHLADWVALVAPPKPPAQAAANPSADSAAIASADEASMKSPRVPPTPGAIVQPTTNEPSTLSQPIEGDEAQSGDDAAAPFTAATDGQSIESLRTPHRLQYGATVELWKPRDPFDPEIFNRRQQSRAQLQTANTRSPAPNAASQKR